jgi:hypothetical protein
MPSSMLIIGGNNNCDALQVWRDDGVKNRICFRSLQLMARLARQWVIDILSINNYEERRAWRHRRMWSNEELGRSEFRDAI